MWNVLRIVEKLKLNCTAGLILYEEAAKGVWRVGLVVKSLITMTDLKYS